MLEPPQCRHNIAPKRLNRAAWKPNLGFILDQNKIKDYFNAAHNTQKKKKKHES